MGVSIVLLLTISIFIPSSISQCSVPKALPYFKRSVYEFSADLVSRIAQENENHFISSAFSPWSLLSAISLGAADETLDEIKQVLRLHPHKCFNGKFFDIIQDLTQGKDSTTLERSSTLFVDNRMSIKEAFKNRIKNTKVTSLEELSFGDYAAVAATINDYVSKATHGTIDDIVKASDLEGVFIVLIDALYFKGSWQNQFSSADTETSAFYDDAGNQIGDVSLMFAEQQANIKAVSQIGATVLELPYGNGRYSMLFFLPDNGQSVTTVLDNLKTISLTSIFTLFGQSGNQQVLVQIPRFKINSDFNNMKEWLTDMGLKAMFDPNLASFSDISDYKLFVSNIIQKASIEVTEEGTEASVASAGFFESRSLKITTAEFTANKPFLFMIVDRELEVALFTGAYSKPSVF